MRRADVLEDVARQERRGVAQTPGEQVAWTAHDVALLHTNVLHHISALIRELGARVLRRNCPDGWGRAYGDKDEEEG